MIVGIIMGICALVMLGIGIAQVKSAKPVPFFSGENPPRAEEVKDVRAWNKKHGMMWIIYGTVILCGMIGGILIGDSPWFGVIFFACILIPPVIMVMYHKKMVKEYTRK